MEMKHRFTRNKIVGVISNAGIIDKVEEVRKEVKCHFEEFFLEPNPRRPVIDGVDFQRLSSEDRLSLEVPFSEEEVRDAIWVSAKEKSPSPYGVSINFFKEYWEILKLDILYFVNEFHSNATLPEGIKASFFSSNPKVH